MWLGLFRGKKAQAMSNSPFEVSRTVPDGFIAPQTAENLLSNVRCQQLLKVIWQRTSLSSSQFKQLYLNPIERYAELVQLFPASESHHHAYLGGMLEHGLEIMAYALKFRQSYLLPIGSSPEERSAVEDCWTAGIAYAALLHDIGKIAVDIHVEYQDGSIWHPWHGPLKASYRFQYQKNREYRLHSVSIGLLYRQIIDTKLLDWLAESHELWTLFTYFIAGQMEQAGVLGELVTKADQASVAQSLGGNTNQVMNSPKHSLQRKLLDGLRYLVKEELKLNNNGPSDGWLTEDGLWLVSKTVSDKLRAYLLSQGIEGIPSKNSILFTALQEHHIILSTNEDKAIWNATVTSHSNGWSQPFTFLKVMPSLIWLDEKPPVFEGTVVINLSKDDSHAEQQSDDNATQKMPSPFTEQNVSDTNHKVEPVVTPNDSLPADSLEAVFNLLELNDEDEQPVLEEIASQLSVTEINPTESNLNIDSHPTNLFNTYSSILQEPTEQKSTLIEFTDTEKQVMKQIDEIIPSGEHFIQWLKDAILMQKLIINEPQALIHTVDDTLFIITPGIFMRYVMEFPQVQQIAKVEKIPAWRYMQKAFEKLKYHKRLECGYSIWTCAVEGPKSTKKVHGYLFDDPTILIPDIVYNNPYLKIIVNINNTLTS
ncbi:MULTISPECIES: MobH family relaxase [unclassified Gilliamella]|uniref:MobH family relaxase n=1 Tax=unclassified Gilliamella TaxID=2685620 RepID=UPI00226A205D|nr:MULTISPECIES: MobH family relaxase [unclassified Gilliamella]MCX8588475.1 TraI domain-containing protein [Gilliamella sp. B3801]MCX8592810.1 TraI domain-containing protein [Gilliamella sp. B3804]